VAQNQAQRDKRLPRLSEGEAKQWFEVFPEWLKFGTGEPFDLKRQPGLPPAGMWSIYRGEKVHDAHLANRIFGRAAAKAGMPLWITLDASEGYAIFQSRHRDQPEDMAAVMNG
jgi:hypothetical protein